MKMIDEHFTNASGRTVGNAPMERNILESLVRWLTGLLLFLFPWQTLWIISETHIAGAKWEYATRGIYATEVVLWICAICFFIWFWKTSAQHKDSRLKRVKQLFSPDRLFALSVLVFTVFCFASSLWAFVSSIGLQHAFWLLEAVLLFFIILLGPLSAKQAIVAVISGGVVQSLLGLFQFLTQSTFASAWLGMSSHPAWQTGTSIISSHEVGRWLRAYGAFPHPNILGGYLALTYILIFANARRQACEKLLVATVPILVTGLFFSFSRSAWLTFWVATVFGFFWVNRRVAAVGAITFLIFSLLFLPLVQTRTGATSSHETRSVQERQQGYAEALTFFQQAPWFGTGIGNFTAAQRLKNPERKGHELQPVHNVPLLVLVEFGLVGTLLVLCCLAALGRFIWTMGRSRRGLVITFICSTTPLFLLDHYLFSLYSGLIMTSIFLALIIKAWLSTSHPLSIHRPEVSP